MWQQWSIGFMGLWVVFLGLLGLSGLALTWTLIVTGFIVAALGFSAAGLLEDRARMRNPYADSVFQ